MDGAPNDPPVELPLDSGTVVRVPVSGGGAYPVLVEPGALDRLPGLVRELAPAHAYALVADSTVAGLLGARVEAAFRDAGLSLRAFSFPAGEASKTRETWARLTDAFLAAGLGRDTAVVALGGGVTADLAGFVAATFLRGVPVVQVPTTLLAMVDASVGGKTGVDVPAGKNLVGAFHPPRAVVADPLVLGTLPRAELSAGMAEVLKHGAVLDRAYFDASMADSAAVLEARPEALVRVVARSVELKSGVVAMDERESGARQILNFGHTLGHALEAASSFSLAHGAAVAVGMILEARLGEGLGVTERGTSTLLETAARAAGLPSRPPAHVVAGDVLAFTQADKKARRGSPRYVLLARLGEVDRDGGWTRPVPAARVLEVLREALDEGPSQAADEGPPRAVGGDAASAS